jgi:uncharacterized protein (TIRG00374 family)
MTTSSDKVTAPTQAPRRPRILLRLGIVAVLLVAAAFFVNPREVIAILARLPPVSVGLAIALLSLDRLMMGLKWRHLVTSAGAQLRLTDAVAIYYQSKFATLVFPAVFGGEIIRGVLGSRAGVPNYVLVASMVVERVVAAVSWIVLAGLGLWYLGTLPSYAQYGHTVTLLAAAAGTCLAAVALLALHRPSHKLIGRVLRRWVPERVFRLLDQLSAATVRYRHAPQVLLTNMSLTLVEHVVQMLALYALAVGLDIGLPALHFFAATAIIMLVRRGAGFLEGWGIAESGIVMLYVLFGVSVSHSAALALALWAASLLACLPGGYLLGRSAWRGVPVDRGKAA